MRFFCSFPFSSSVALLTHVVCSIIDESDGLTQSRFVRKKSITISMNNHQQIHRSLNSLHDSIAQHQQQYEGAGGFSELPENSNNTSLGDEAKPVTGAGSARSKRSAEVAKEDKNRFLHTDPDFRSLSEQFPHVKNEDKNRVLNTGPDLPSLADKNRVLNTGPDLPSLAEQVPHVKNEGKNKVLSTEPDRSSRTEQSAHYVTNKDKNRLLNTTPDLRTIRIPNNRLLYTYPERHSRNEQSARATNEGKSHLLHTDPSSRAEQSARATNEGKNHVLHTDPSSRVERSPRASKESLHPNETLFSSRMKQNVVDRRVRSGRPGQCRNAIQINSSNPTGEVSITCPRQAGVEDQVGNIARVTVMLEFKEPGAQSFSNLGLITGGWDNISFINYQARHSWPLYQGGYASGTYKTGGLTITLNNTSCRHDGFELSCRITVINNSHIFDCVSSAVFHPAPPVGQLEMSCWRNPDFSSYVMDGYAIELTCSAGPRPLTRTAWLWEYSQDGDSVVWQSVNDVVLPPDNACVEAPNSHSVVVRLTNQSVCDRIYRCSLVTLTDTGLVRTRLGSATLPAFTCTDSNDENEEASASELPVGTYLVVTGIVMGTVAILVVIGLYVYVVRKRILRPTNPISTYAEDSDVIRHSFQRGSVQAPPQHLLQQDLLQQSSNIVTIPLEFVVSDLESEGSVASTDVG